MHSTRQQQQQDMQVSLQQQLGMAKLPVLRVRPRLLLLLFLTHFLLQLQCSNGLQSEPKQVSHFSCCFFLISFSSCYCWQNSMCVLIPDKVFLQQHCERKFRTSCFNHSILFTWADCITNFRHTLSTLVTESMMMLTLSRLHTMTCLLPFSAGN